MKSLKIKLLFALLVALFITSCTGGDSKTNEEAKTETVAAEETKTFNVWKVPNVIEGAEAYFSPDGKSLIFNGKMENDENHLVYTVNIDGSNLKRINNKGYDACSFYHPTDKNKIVWTSTKDCQHSCTGNYSDPQDYPQGAELYMSDLDGGNLVRLTDNEFYDAEISISPNGEKILFGRQMNGEMDLWTMDMDGNNQKQVTFTPEWQEGGAFYMTDNKTILFRAWKKSDEGQRGLPMTIFTIKDDGSELTTITNNEGTNWAPFPAPDGKHFAYVKVLPPHNYEIFIMNLETKEEVQLTHSDAFDGFPAISPDGKSLSFSSGRGAKEGERSLTLYLMDISSLNIGAASI